MGMRACLSGLTFLKDSYILKSFLKKKHRPTSKILDVNLKKCMQPACRRNIA